MPERIIKLTFMVSYYEKTLEREVKAWAFISPCFLLVPSDWWCQEFWPKKYHFMTHSIHVVMCGKIWVFYFSALKKKRDNVIIMLNCLRISINDSPIVADKVMSVLLQRCKAKLFQRCTKSFKTCNRMMLSKRLSSITICKFYISASSAHCKHVILITLDDLN